MDKKNKKLITHNGSFHADDIFAAATLSLILEKKGQSFEIIRTRDTEIIKTGDYVFDVGGVYDEEKNKFDHHQKGGAGARENGIEYSSFGLVWKKFGQELVESEKIVKSIDRRLVAPIDAGDNGLDLVESKNETHPYFLQYFFNSMNPAWSEKNLDADGMFLKSIEIAKIILSREIVQAKDFILAEEKIIKDYTDATDKKVVILAGDYLSENVLNNFSEPLFVIYPRSSDGFWSVRAVREDLKSFKNRKNLPAGWAGLRDEELQKVTGVSDAVFCHRALFLAVAKSKEGAIRLAELALLEPNN